MPLPFSQTYALTLLRSDGRRWNELRLVTADISTQPGADGSAVLELGGTKVIASVWGPAEMKVLGAATGGAVAGAMMGGTTGGSEGEGGDLIIDLSIAPFATTDRRRRGRLDKTVATLRKQLHSLFHPHLFPLPTSSTLVVRLNALSTDGSLLAACVNVATLALVDAGVPMRGWVCGCTAGLISSSASTHSSNATRGDDPLLDLNHEEETECACMTVVTSGPPRHANDNDDDAAMDVDEAQDSTEEGTVNLVVMESKCAVERLETMMAVGIDGCARIRTTLDGVVRRAAEVR